MSRQVISPDSTNTNNNGAHPRPSSSLLPADSPPPPAPSTNQPSSPSSPGSEKRYPSWLPKRPPPPEPASTLPSAREPRTSTDADVDDHDHDDSAYPSPHGVLDALHRLTGHERKPTPRSIRIINIAPPAPAALGPHTPENNLDIDGGDEKTGKRRSQQPYNRASIMSHMSLSAELALPPMPRFRARAHNLALLRNPSLLFRVWHVLLPFFAIVTFALQTFFDFNVVYILLQVSKHPNFTAPGVPGSGRNWALACAAYLACYFVWFFVVLILFEFVYSFWRRWRTKRPAILPLYLSTPAFTYVCMTSYTNFSFFTYIRAAAFSHTVGGSWRDGLAETFYFYSQNAPTVGLLLPRAGICVAVLLAFGGSQIEGVVVGNNGGEGRDPTFFRAADGGLSGYAMGILYANAAWAAWRALVLIASWLGLWILSGQRCAGVCGPRYRWEESALEESAAEEESVLEDERPDRVEYGWAWRQGTRVRVREAWEFCATGPTGKGRAEKRTSRGSGVGEKGKGKGRVRGSVGNLKRGSVGNGNGDGEDGVIVERVLADNDQLYGSPGASSSARQKSKSTSFPILPVPIPAGMPGPSKPAPILLPQTSSSSSGPLKALPYPFAQFPAAVGGSGGSETRVAFPPKASKDEDGSKNGNGNGGAVIVPVRSGVPSAEGLESSGVDADVDHGDEEEEEEPEYDDAEYDDAEGEGEEGEEEGDETYPGRRRRESSEHGTGSMSSLGQPVNTRYPFGFRRPPGARAGAHSEHTTSTHSQVSGVSGVSRRSIATSVSASVSATGSPGSGMRTASVSASASASGSRRSDSGLGGIGGVVIPPPPSSSRAHGHRHGRRRAGTVPSVPSVSSGQLSPRGPPLTARARTNSASASSSASVSASGSVVHDRTFGPGPAPMYEYDAASGTSEAHGGDEEEEGVYEAEGSQEEAEKEDSLGLLGPSPSPKSSLGALRHHAFHHQYRTGGNGNGHGQRQRRGSGSTGAGGGGSSRSASGSASVSAGTRSVSGASSRSASASMRATSPRGMGMGIGGGSSRSASGSVSSRGRASNEYGSAEHTFGRQVEWTETQMQGTSKAASISPSPPPIPPSSSTVLGPSTSTVLARTTPATTATTMATTATQPIPIPVPAGASSPARPANIDDPRSILRPVTASSMGAGGEGLSSSAGHPDISEAPSSYVTAAPSPEEGSEDSAGRSGGSYSYQIPGFFSPGGNWGKPQ
ncbi:hypothetical protein BOTBODRAFT_56655 [Botryobasidium botryosum FD-172 SS1]|uniref:Proteophosphoglycan ppg4 n=1 Tax=Botryobasidium botryosum (strain FD-172 SS1) TaxID=930990 RepID=A0A067MAJ6_BOTB1|nr:hypothetical protein BOTBODRAFT_56655 [Botryobasidium botryosum FD-172 SS1]